MSQDTAVDCLDAVARFAREIRDTEVERAALPEPAGAQVVDYLAVSQRWEEEKAEMLRPVRASGPEDR